MWHTDRGEKIHTPQGVFLFVYSSQDELILAFALCVYLKAGENGECLKSWHNESEWGDGECEGEGRAVKVWASALTAFSCCLAELCLGYGVSPLLPLQGFTDVAAAVSAQPWPFHAHHTNIRPSHDDCFSSTDPLVSRSTVMGENRKLKTGCHVMTDGPRCQ